jgi:glycosyltransferase involved in cell wall biosynthesis
MNKADAESFVSLNPDISVVIPVYNGAELLQRCLQSVFAQQLPDGIETEVLVVDDGSTDGSLEILKAYGEKIIFMRQVHQGPAAARNRGIARASGRFLAFLDADDYWKPTFLRETLAFLQEQPEAIGVSVGQSHRYLGKPEQIIPAFLNEKDLTYAPGRILSDFFSFWAEHNHLCTGSVLIRMEIIRKAGGQLEDLRLSQDLEYWAYLATFGPWGFLPQILFVSDGDRVTRKVGWWNKKRERWGQAPDIARWERRIRKRLPETPGESYFKCRARVALNLAYAFLLSNRLEAGRAMILECSNYLPENRLAKLLSFTSKSSISWWMLAKMLVFKEKRRKF